MQEVITDYHTNLFTASNSEWIEVVDCVPHTTLEEQNELLMQEVSSAEVKQTLFQMHPAKFPGSDEMTPAFYQKHWTIVGNDSDACKPE